MKETLQYKSSDYRDIVYKIEKAFLEHHSPDTYPTVELSVTITVDHKKIPNDIEQLRSVYDFDEELTTGTIARIFHYSGLTVADLLTIEKDLRGLIPKKYLHSKRKFALESLTWGMDNYKDITVKYPQMVKYLENGVLLEDTAENRTDLFMDICRFVSINPSPDSIYAKDYNKWKHVHFENMYLEYESE